MGASGCRGLLVLAFRFTGPQRIMHGLDQFALGQRNIGFLGRERDDDLQGILGRCAVEQNSRRRIRKHVRLLDCESPDDAQKTIDVRRIGNPYARFGGLRLNRENAKIPQRLAPDAAIGNEDLDIVIALQLGPEQGERLYRSQHAADLDLLSHAEGTEDQQHDPGSQM